MLHRFTSQVPCVRWTPDKEVQRARQRVAIETSGFERPAPKVRNLPTISTTEAQKRCYDRPVIILEGYLIDVGTFATEHPGGEGLLRAGFGARDLSQGFWKLNHHTQHARGLVEDMRIAKISDDRTNHENVIKIDE
jgi:cytochrome b involved in lipid metabolism